MDGLGNCLLIDTEMFNAKVEMIYSDFATQCLNGKKSLYVRVYRCNGLLIDT